MCVSKALTGGLLPFAATLATESLYDRFRGDLSRAVMHGHTYTGNPLGAAVALETLNVFDDERVLEQMPPRCEAVSAAFTAMAAIPGAVRPRALGMIGAIDLGEGGYYGTRGWAVHEAAKTRGVWLRPLGDTVYVVPPRTISMDDLKEMLDVVTESVAEVSRV